MVIIQSDPKNMQVFVTIDDLKNKNFSAIKKAFFLIGKKLVADTAADILRKPRFGRIYRYKGRKHIASVRGEAPANRSGFLRKSLIFKTESATNMRFGYAAQADYGKYLESEKSLDRPALKINVLKNENSMRNIFEQELKTALGAL